MQVRISSKLKTDLRQKFCYRQWGVEGGRRIRCAKSDCYRGGMDRSMSQTTRKELLEKLRRRYRSAGLPHKHKLLGQAQELLGYHRKAAIRALRAEPVARGPRLITGRPRHYEPGLLLEWLRPIWQATDYACGRRLAAMLPEWIPAFEAYERRMPAEVREKLLERPVRAHWTGCCTRCACRGLGVR